MNEIVKGISVVGDQEIIGYFGYQHYGVLNIDIPVIYTIDGRSTPVHMSSVKKVLNGVRRLDGLPVFYGDIFRAKVKRNGNDVFLFVMIKEVDGQPCICPFAGDITSYEIGSIKLEQCEYVGMTELLLDTISKSVVGYDSELIYRVANNISDTEEINDDRDSE